MTTVDFQRHLDAVDLQHESVRAVLTQISEWTRENAVPGDSAKFLSAVKGALRSAGVNLDEVSVFMPKESDTGYEEIEDYHFPPKTTDGTWAQVAPTTGRWVAEYGFSQTSSTWVLRMRWTPSNDSSFLEEWHTAEK